MLCASLLQGEKTEGEVHNDLPKQTLYTIISFQVHKQFSESSFILGLKMPLILFHFRIFHLYTKMLYSSILHDRPPGCSVLHFGSNTRKKKKCWACSVHQCTKHKLHETKFMFPLIWSHNSIPWGHLYHKLSPGYWNWKFLTN